MFIISAQYLYSFYMEFNERFRIEATAPQIPHLMERYFNNLVVVFKLKNLYLIIDSTAIKA